MSIEKKSVVLERDERRRKEKRIAKGRDFYNYKDYYFDCIR